MKKEVDKNINWNIHYNDVMTVVRVYEEEVHKLPSKTTVLELIQWLRKKAEVK
jgi:hypothetical protein